MCNSSLGLSFVVGIKSFYCSTFTSQHKVHQVHKSTRYFHQSHTTFPQFVHLLNNIYPKHFLHVFLQDSYWNTTDKVLMSTLLSLLLLLLLSVYIYIFPFNLMSMGLNSIDLYIYYNNKHIL